MFFCGGARVGVRPEEPPGLHPGQDQLPHRSLQVQSLLQTTLPENPQNHFAKPAKLVIFDITNIATAIREAAKKKFFS